MNIAFEILPKNLSNSYEIKKWDGKRRRLKIKQKHTAYTNTRDYMNRIGYNFTKMRLTKNKWVNMNFMRLAMKKKKKVNEKNATRENKNNNQKWDITNKQPNKRKKINSRYISIYFKRVKEKRKCASHCHNSCVYINAKKSVVY